MEASCLNPGANGPVDAFVVDTPLQLLNALEARDRFQIAGPELLILLWPGWRRETFAAVSQRQNWRRTRYFRMFPAKGWEVALANSTVSFLQTFWRWLLRFRFERALRPLRGARRLFVGNYRNHYMRHGAAVVGASELVLLDDGTDSLVFARELRQLETNPESPPPARKFRLRSWMRQRYIDWNETVAPRLTFFSSYALQLRTSDTLIRHRYELLRRSYSSARAGTEIFLLGQPLVADGYCSDSDYFEYLRAVRAHYGDQPIVYIPHPRETDVAAREAADALGGRLQRLKIPVELHLLTSDARPARLAGFFCSALDNCRQLFGDTIVVDAFVFESAHLRCSHDSVAEVYRYLDSAGVHVHHVRSPQPARASPVAVLEGTQ